MKWYHTSICLVRAWYWWSFVSAIADWLSENKVVTRECHGFLKPAGFAAGFSGGTGLGWEFCTPKKPVPVARVPGYPRRDLSHSRFCQPWLNHLHCTSHNPQNQVFTFVWAYYSHLQPFHPTIYWFITTTGPLSPVHWTLLRWVLDRFAR